MMILAECSIADASFGVADRDNSPVWIYNGLGMPRLTVHYCSHYPFAVSVWNFPYLLL